LAVLGVKLCPLDLLAPIRKGVQIAQKQVKYSPFEKLYDCFIGILAGAQGVAEINERLRADPALQAAFGRTACAEPSVIQDTLNAATPANVAQMEQALDQIYRQHSHAAHHDFAQRCLLLDADMSGMPGGKKAALATKGYFEGQKNRRGRQLARVLAGDYDEIVVDQVYPGNVQLVTALPTVVAAAETRLALTAEQKARTILRVDAGGGSLDDINWALSRGYQVHAKDCSSQRAKKLGESVTVWYEDPKVPGRQAGRVEAAAPEYVRPVRRVAVRCRMANGQWKVAVLISTVAPETVRERTGVGEAPLGEPEAPVLGDVYLYDQRGGGVETSLKGDKQGLGLTKRNKKRFEAQQVVVAWSALAHNVLIWARDWMAPAVPLIERYGIERLVRDVFGISGAVERDSGGQVRRIVLNEASGLAQRCLAGFQRLLGAGAAAAPRCCLPMKQGGGEANVKPNSYVCMSPHVVAILGQT
jgi:hypothetical protein